jgi:hypothetical protein
MMKLRGVSITGFYKNRTSISHKPARANAGGVLVEILCCAVIVSMLAAHIAESSGMMVRISASGLETRTRTLDFHSIAGEVERAGSSGSVFRGSWQAIADVCESEKGIGKIGVSVSLRSDEAPDAIRWIVWDIRGRAR